MGFLLNGMSCIISLELGQKYYIDNSLLSNYQENISIICCSKLIHSTIYHYSKNIAQFFFNSEANFGGSICEKHFLLDTNLFNFCIVLYGKYLLRKAWWHQFAISKKNYFFFPSVAVIDFLLQTFAKILVLKSYILHMWLLNMPPNLESNRITDIQFKTVVWDLCSDNKSPLKFQVNYETQHYLGTEVVLQTLIKLLYFNPIQQENLYLRSGIKLL